MNSIEEKIGELKFDVLTSPEIWGSLSNKEINTFVLNIVKNNFPYLTLGDAKRLVLGLQEKLEIGSYMPVNIRECLIILEEEYESYYDIPEKIVEIINSVISENVDVLPKFLEVFGDFKFVNQYYEEVSFSKLYEENYNVIIGEEYDDVPHNIHVYKEFLNLLKYLEELFDSGKLSQTNKNDKDFGIIILGNTKFNLNKIYDQLLSYKPISYDDLLNELCEILRYSSKAYKYLEEYYQNDYDISEDTELDKEIFDSYFPTTIWLNQDVFNKINNLISELCKTLKL